MSEMDPLTRPPDGAPEDQQPKWRRDFPIDWSQDQYVARREFTKFMVLTSFAFVIGQAWIVVKQILKDERPALPRKLIARVSQIPVGGFKVFHYPDAGHPRLLIRLSRTRFVAYDQRCTHLSCPVIPEVAAGTLHCPCHHGSFDLASGRVLAGPPRRPLPRVELAIDGDRIYALGVKERTS